MLQGSQQQDPSLGNSAAPHPLSLLPAAEEPRKGAPLPTSPKATSPAPRKGVVPGRAEGIEKKSG
jgi:hypothetical protein